MIRTRTRRAENHAEAARSTDVEGAISAIAPKTAPNWRDRSRKPPTLRPFEAIAQWIAQSLRDLLTPENPAEIESLTLSAHGETRFPPANRPSTPPSRRPSPVCKVEG